MKAKKLTYLSGLLAALFLCANVAQASTTYCTPKKLSDQLLFKELIGVEYNSPETTIDLSKDTKKPIVIAWETQKSMLGKINSTKLLEGIGGADAAFTLTSDNKSIQEINFSHRYCRKSGLSTTVRGRAAATDKITLKPVGAINSSGQQDVEIVVQRDPGARTMQFNSANKWPHTLTCTEFSDPRKEFLDAAGNQYDNPLLATPELALDNAECKKFGN